MNHMVRASVLAVGYFRTMCDMTMRGLGKVGVLAVKMRHTYLASVIFSEIPW